MLEVEQPPLGKINALSLVRLTHQLHYQLFHGMLKGFHPLTFHLSLSSVFVSNHSSLISFTQETEHNSCSSFISLVVSLY